MVCGGGAHIKLEKKSSGGIEELEGSGGAGVRFHFLKKNY